MSTRTESRPLFNGPIVAQAVADALRKLDPRHQVRNPVMFTVLIGSALTTILGFDALIHKGEEPASFILAISAWLWFTVLFGNFAEAMAEGRGKAQADTLRKSRRDVQARILATPNYGAPSKLVPGSTLKKGDVVVAEAGEFIPMDGEVIEGAASVDESAITGESAPVIRESGGDRSSVTGGTRVLSDWLVIRISTEPGESFLERMIAMVEGAKRQKTPNEIALNILLASLTIIFLLATVTLLPFSLFSVREAGQGSPISVTVLVALLVCLIPTTIGALLSAIGIAGMDRMLQANVLAMSGRAVEAAGDVDVLLLDKTGTITLGNRQAVAFVPAPGVSEREAELAALNVMGLATPNSAILSAVIFNALIIVMLIPLALRGIAYKPVPASVLLRRHLLIYGLGGIILPFIGIKIIDITGSRLLGQPFENPKYFWSRPSATGPFAYNTASSSRSNFGPLNPDFRKALETRIAALKAANPQGGDIPIDLITASASGLDPHTSPAAAEYQLARVSNVRGINVAHARELIARYTDAPQLGFLGNAGVNVLLLNQALDRKE